MAHEEGAEMEMNIDSRLVRAERSKRAWSQEHLASAAGIGLRTVQRIETAGVASYESVRAIAAAFEMEPSDLILDAAPSSSLETRAAVEGHRARPLPALVLAAGVLGGTGAALFASGRLWWAGALVMACAIIIARALDNRRKRAGGPGILHAVYFATTCFLALMLVAYAEPRWVAMMMPMIGGASVVVLHRPLSCLFGRRGSPVGT
jgi:transcriptional regulator with XRE-family HTH domain